MNPPEREYNNNSVEPELVGSTQDINKSLFSSTDIGDNSLAKVRDILFGNQMREIEKRFTRIEERLAKECDNLREETRKRLDSLEIYLKKEVEFVTERLKHEQAEREEYKNLTMSLEKKLAQFDEQTTQSQRELREHILNQSKNLHDEIQQKYEEILALLQKESQELDKEKTNRSTLANLFAELAIRLNSQD